MCLYPKEFKLRRATKDITVYKIVQKKDNKYYPYYIFHNNYNTLVRDTYYNKNKHYCYKCKNIIIEINNSKKKLEQDND